MNFKKKVELPVFDPTEEGTDWNLKPSVINSTGNRHGVKYIAGGGAKGRLMFIAPSAEECEMSETLWTNEFTGHSIKHKPEYLKGDIGNLLKKCFLQAGIQDEDYYYTALCKWLLPKGNRNKPKARQVEWAAEALHNEILEVKPKIIICLGKAPFDFLFPYKLKLREIIGGLFQCEKYNCKLFCMDIPSKPLYSPEYVEKYHEEFTEVKDILNVMEGLPSRQEQYDEDYRVIHNSKELEEIVEFWKKENHTQFAVDCEWAGGDYVRGKLRSIQLSWKSGTACYVRFMDDQEQFAFDVSYARAGEILGSHLNNPEVRYLGHQLSADFVWMKHWLNLDVYKKAMFDTLYAQQCIDEYADQKLEKMAMIYTSMPRYDVDLIVWKKENKVSNDEGYGRIPDEILIPYAQRDVDVVHRMYPQLNNKLMTQGMSLVRYYYGLFLSFVTDIFVNFTMVGLPMDRVRIDNLRVLYQLTGDKLKRLLVLNIKKEASEIFFDFCKENIDNGGPIYLSVTTTYIEDPVGARDILKKACGVKHWKRGRLLFDHWCDCMAGFNINSTNLMRRWLFEVKDHRPLKSTARKDEGIPSIAWEKIEAYPPSKQKEFSPSTDKQTLKVLSVKDPILKELLRYKSVATLTKSFLRPADVDDDGKIVKENGLHYWICDDDRIHGNYSTTETGRPRAWKPNALNWPGFVHGNVSDAIKYVVKNLNDTDPEDIELKRAFDIVCVDGKLPSLRSCVTAPEGWCFVESDYQTAEVRALAFISGDEKLIATITEPDAQFALIEGYDIEDPEDSDKVRLMYADDCEIDEENRFPDILNMRVNETHKRDELLEELGEIPLTKTITLEDGEVEAKAFEANGKVLYISPIDKSKLIHNEDGTLYHPRHDVHWELAEAVNGKPREVMGKKVERAAGKVGNFQYAYGSTDGNLERSIEEQTGHKPEEGTGQALLDSIGRKQPGASTFLVGLESVPEEKGEMQAASGRKRHFKVHGKGSGVSRKDREKSLSPLTREARNFLMQESVAATSARAAIKLTDYFLDNNMSARVCVLLYDSIVTLCRLEDRFEVAKLHKKYMYTDTTWEYHGRELSYPIDTEFVYSWSFSPTKSEKEDLVNTDWNTK